VYNPNDTICATATASVSTGTVARSIIRITGAETFAIISEIFSTKGPVGKHGVIAGRIRLDIGLEIDTDLYCFGAPRSYTGEDLAELHFFAAPAVVECILEKLCRLSRLAGPGEFTLRAYLNGRIDLSQAEAVAQIVAGSNKFQIQAAQKLLAGKLAQTAEKIHSRILDILSLLEAGMDFSEEDIEFVTKENAVGTIGQIRADLQALLDGNIRYEEMIDLPAVGLAGASNAGKSSLLNALLGSERSIVSPQQATTRDVLTGVMEGEKSRCMLFDCAGLGPGETSAGLLDELGRQAAMEAINAADVVLLCVDMDKADYTEDICISKSIAKEDYMFVATKSDLLDKDSIRTKSEQLGELFASDVIVCSAVTGSGIEQLRGGVEKHVISITAGACEAADRIAINQRHARLVREAIANLDDAGEEIAGENNEIAAMLLRSSCEKLAGLEKEDIDDAILDRIFSNFCIGK
jgi:tRNA modification GTPase